METIPALKDLSMDGGQPQYSKFDPIDSLPDELWITILESPCTFPPEAFSGVMLNLIKNPNVTSSYLFRADIFYDSDNDRTPARDGRDEGLVKHLKHEYRPVSYDLPGFERTRTFVRQLIPRNPQLDKPLIQTCHFYSKFDEEGEQNVVVYLPHVSHADDMPFYHPAVSKLAFEHRWQVANSSDLEDCAGKGSISISYKLFEGTPLTTKLERTALRLLQTVHKHGQGQVAGYEKRVHLDQVLPQKRYQDTYTRLKSKYGRQLSEQWVEVTDPGKHVFEDIGIASFLIEVWRDMYRMPGDEGRTHTERESDDGCGTGNPARPDYPGFVDIGCGNGVLVYVLLMEGYEGWGFDARERKTWRILPEHIQERLQRRLLIPEIFNSAKVDVAQTTESPECRERTDGTFEPPGTFVISNHADELTAWTPLLAYLNNSSFIAIPCCSHDLAGSRFRAPVSTKAMSQATLKQQDQRQGVARLPQQHCGDVEEEQAKKDLASKAHSQAAETGSLKRTEAQKKMPSAYSTLCSYVTSLAVELEFEVENEVLRIPSTRNQCIIGRWNQGVEDTGARTGRVVGIVERELGRSLEAVGADWIARAQKLAKKPGSGH